MEFEYWSHAACLLPLEHFRYYLPAMLRRRQDENGWAWRMLNDAEEPAQVLENVRRRVHQEGALRSADFEHHQRKAGAWWDWKPAKAALEHLYDTGELMVSGRVSFQRIYDLQERVLPAWVDTRLPDEDETRRFFLGLGARGLGVCLPDQLGDYTYMKKTAARPGVQALLKSGELQAVRGILADGSTQELVVHREILPWLERAADGEYLPQRTTFLSFFDSLFWARERDRQFWNFKNTIEAYKPAPTRQWGYYCLPILHRGQLIGRLDPKLERAARRLRLKALYLEPGVEPGERLVSEVAAALRDFMRFHQAEDVVIERSEPEGVGRSILNAL
ncbi:MAG: winged helix DNA-binding domain-containing protein [Anaerolineales bacterium]|nr:winged helix DNA-binding domain-containing protein [Anaerolineales bacterium]